MAPKFLPARTHATLASPWNALLQYNGADDWTGLAAVRSNLPKLTGKGVNVGILDCGTDYK